jgi:hypothetical protein
VWAGIVVGVGGGVAALDLWCDAGEPDNDTLTECGRALLDKLPFGWELFAVSCVGVPAWFYRHMAKGRG